LRAGNASIHPRAWSRVSAPWSVPALREPALLILISLADGPKHGYAMTTDIDRGLDNRLET
jgi:hypothetical protein